MIGTIKISHEQIAMVPALCYGPQKEEPVVCEWIRRKIAQKSVKMRLLTTYFLFLRDMLGFLLD